FYEDGPLRRVELPTYPFANDRFPISVGVAPVHKSRVESGPRNVQIVTPLFGASIESIEKCITRRISHVLALPEGKIKPNVDFRNYGLDSLAGTTLRRGLEEIFHVAVSGKDVLVHATVSSLAACIETKIKAAVLPVYRKSANGSGHPETDDDLVLRALAGF